MPYFITWNDGHNERKVSVQKLDEIELKSNLIAKGIKKFEVEYFEYTETNK